MSDVGEVAVSVRALCQFTARRGDLDLALRPSATAAEGLALHRRMALTGTPGMRHEVAVSATLGGLRVRGRADAIDESDPEQVTIEELKSYRGRYQQIPTVRSHLHWAQVETYAALHAFNGLEAGEPSGDPSVADIQPPQMQMQMQMRLRYVNVDTEEAHVQTRRESRGDLIERLRARVTAFRAWAESEAAHRKRRDEAIRDLPFPMPEFRAGQRDLAGQIYRSCLRGRRLLAEAPTGLGKSLAAVFGALKGLQAGRLDKLFLLTCRTTGAESLLRAMAQCNGARAIRVLELGSRDRACQRPGARCTAQDCDLAIGFYDKLPAARAEAVASRVGTMAALASLAATHKLCPYHLSHELVLWADVIVADVNHYFDRSAGLQALTVAENWKTVVIVDEAHDLIDRSRSMYSRALGRPDVERLGQALPELVELGALARSWRRFEQQHQSTYQEVRLPVRFSEKLAAAATAVAAALPELPPADPNRENLVGRAIDIGFDLVALQSLAASAGSGDTIELLRESPQAPTQLRVRSIVPAGHLAGAWSAAEASILMSATLRPFEFHRDLLGLGVDAAQFECPSPYNGQLRVVIRRDVSTRYRDRAGSAGRIATLVCDAFRDEPGNYMVYASSYQYLRLLHEEIVHRDPAIDTWMQVPRMSDADRRAFLARFALDGRGLGFAVLGGGFGEGIDLGGSRLSGAFIATLGMPQVNPANEVTRRLIEQRFGDGWRLGYLIPGLTKVAQAGGRVVRGAADRGVLHLLDDRYSLAQVREALPRWWFS